MAPLFGSVLETNVDVMDALERTVGCADTG